MYQYPDNTNRLIVCFGSVFLASMAYVFVGMAIYGSYPTISMDSVLEDYLGYLFIIFFMGIMAIVLTMIPILYNFLMRNSKAIQRLSFEQRHDFLATNSSWLLLRLAAFFLMVAMGLAGVAAAHAMIPASGQSGIGLKLIVVCIFVGPFIVGVLIAVKWLIKLNLMAYKWRISDAPARL